MYTELFYENNYYIWPFSQHGKVHHNIQHTVSYRGYLRLINREDSVVIRYMINCIRVTMVNTYSKGLHIRHSNVILKTHIRYIGSTSVKNHGMLGYSEIGTLRTV